MSETTRREFLETAGSVVVAAPAVQTLAQSRPNEQINVAVVGFHSRGMAHIRAFARIPNVRVAAICDVDERLFAPAVNEVENISYRLGRTLVFDPQKETFVNDAEADKYLTRTYRGPYVLPRVSSSSS